MFRVTVRQEEVMALYIVFVMEVRVSVCGAWCSPVGGRVIRQEY